MSKIEIALADMHARPIMYNFTTLNESCDDIHYDILHDFIKTQLTPKEINFLLLSEEERVNTYKNYEEIWKSCVSKLEKQKEMLE